MEVSIRSFDASTQCPILCVAIMHNDDGQRQPGHKPGQRDELAVAVLLVGLDLHTVYPRNNREERATYNERTK